jgi:hypothetical protein
MGNRNRVVVTGLFLLAACVPRLPAQDNTADLFGGYTYAKANPESPLPKTNMHGWAGSAAAFPASWFGVGTEISAVFGDIAPPSGVSGPGLHAKEYTYLAGPQLRFVNLERVQSSFKLLLGGVFGQVRLDASTTAAAAQQLGAAGYSSFDQTKFAALFAVPVDVTITKLMAWRVEPGLYLTDFNRTKQSNFRFSTGLVFRFGGK